MTVPSLHYRPAKTIGEFLASDARVRGIIGPWGSGKSSACAMEVLRRAREQKQGPDGKRRTRFAVVRNSYRELKDTSRKTFDDWLGHLGKWHEGDAELHLAFADVRCEILFRSLDKPGDIKKLLSLELTGAYLNEAKELARAHLDALTGRIDRYPSMAKGGRTWSGVWFDSNPVHSTHWLARLMRETPAYRLFRQPGGRSPEAENRENLHADYYTNLSIGKEQEWIDVCVDGKDPKAAEGSIYGSLIAALDARGGLKEYAHPNDTCWSAWDIGTSDATAIWTYRINEETRLPDIIDFYENHGESAEHYVNVLNSKPYTYVRHLLPWDAAPPSWSTGKSHAQQLMEWWPGRVATVPRNDVANGIAAGRWLLERKGLRIHPRCHEGIERLRSYRYRYDPNAQAFSKDPVHDFSSHGADAFRGLACALNRSEIETRPAAPPVDELKPVSVQLINGVYYMPVGLDTLHDDREQQLSHTRRRI